MSALRPTFLALLAFCVSIATTAWVWQHERLNAHQKLRAQFEFGLSDISGRIAQRVATYEQMLRGAQGFYSSGIPNRQQFRTYVESLQLGSGFVGIQGIGLALIVAPAEIAAHEATIRREGFPAYRVHPTSGLTTRAPIVQAEPSSSPNLIALGFDPYSDPVRRAAMDRARDTGEPTISGKLNYVLDKEPEASPSFIIYAAVFKPGTAHSTPETRLTNTVGWVYAPVRMREMMAGLYGEHNPDIEVSVYDSTEPDPASLLYNTGKQIAERTDAALHAHAYLDVAGHRWLIEASANPDFEAKHGRNDSTLIAISGFLMSALLAVIAWLMAGSRSRAIDLAMKMTEELRASEERWKFALDGAGDGVWDRNLSTDEIYFSRRCREIFGYSKGEFGNHRSEWITRIHPDDLERALADTQACVEGRTRNFSSEYRLRCKNGDWKWILSRGHVTSYDANGKPLRLIGTVSDISERKHAEERIRHMAQHDMLTGLPNRALFFDRLQQALAQARRDATRIALLFVDLDRFKPINDDYGHAVGDQVLQQVAQRLRDVVRESDTVGRIGGDEFVVLLPTIQHEADAQHVADKLRDALASPLMIETLQVCMSASIGIALFPDHGDDETSLMKTADLAMYRAKQAGTETSRQETCAARAQSGSQSGSA